MKQVYPFLRSVGKQIPRYDISTYAASASFFIITSLFSMLMLVLIITMVLWGFGHTILGLFQKYLPYLGRVFSLILEFRGLALFAVIALILDLIYGFFPHKKMKLVMQLPGAVFASSAWLIFSELYSMYVEYALSSSMIYGSLGMIVLAMLWVYFCVIILFWGAVLNKTIMELRNGSALQTILE